MFEILRNAAAARGYNIDRWAPRNLDDGRNIAFGDGRFMIGDVPGEHAATADTTRESLRALELYADTRTGTFNLITALQMLDANPQLRLVWSPDLPSRSDGYPGTGYGGGRQDPNMVSIHFNPLGRYVDAPPDAPWNDNNGPHNVAILGHEFVHAIEFLRVIDEGTARQFRRMDMLERLVPDGTVVQMREEAARGIGFFTGFPDSENSLREELRQRGYEQVVNAPLYTHFSERPDLYPPERFPPGTPRDNAYGRWINDPSSHQPRSANESLVNPEAKASKERASDPSRGHADVIWPYADNEKYHNALKEFADEVKRKPGGIKAAFDGDDKMTDRFARLVTSKLSRPLELIGEDDGFAEDVTKETDQDQLLDMILQRASKEVTLDLQMRLGPDFDDYLRNGGQAQLLDLTRQGTARWSEELVPDATVTPQPKPTKPPPAEPGPEPDPMTDPKPDPKPEPKPKPEPITGKQYSDNAAFIADKFRSSIRTFSLPFGGWKVMYNVQIFEENELVKRKFLDMTRYRDKHKDTGPINYDAKLNEAAAAFANHSIVKEGKGFKVDKGISDGDVKAPFQDLIIKAIGDQFEKSSYKGPASINMEKIRKKVEHDFYLRVEHAVKMHHGKDKKAMMKAYGKYIKSDRGQTDLKKTSDEGKNTFEKDPYLYIRPFKPDQKDFPWRTVLNDILQSMNGLPERPIDKMINVPQQFVRYLDKEGSAKRFEDWYKNNPKDDY